mgnify:CR=1 FL=1
MAGKDPFWSKLEAGLHFEGANGQYNFVDVKGRTVEFVGNPTISTTKKKFGNSSAKFDGNSYLTIGLPAMADFTFDFWINPSSPPPAGYYMFIRANWAQDYCNVALRTDGIVFGNDSTIVGPLSLVPVGVWTHLAFQRAGSTRYFFVNGQLKHQSPIYTIGVACGMQFFGAHDLQDFDGYVDDLRVTSAARWTENFTPLNEPFPHGAYEVGGTILDSLGNPAARKVRAYRRDTGALVGEGITNTTTGEYRIAVDYDGEVSVVMFDDDNEVLENDQVLRTFSA